MLHREESPTKEQRLTLIDRCKGCHYPIPRAKEPSFRSRPHSLKADSRDCSLHGDHRPSIKPRPTIKDREDGLRASYGYQRERDQNKQD